MYEKFGQFIDGKWQASEKGETYEVINPATEEVIGKASKTSPSVHAPSPLESINGSSLKVPTLTKLRVDDKKLSKLILDKSAASSHEVDPTTS